MIIQLSNQRQPLSHYGFAMNCLPRQSPPIPGLKPSDVGERVRRSASATILHGLRYEFSSSIDCFCRYGCGVGDRLFLSHSGLMPLLPQVLKLLLVRRRLRFITRTFYKCLPIILSMLFIGFSFMYGYEPTATLPCVATRNPYTRSFAARCGSVGLEAMSWSTRSVILQIVQT